MTHKDFKAMQIYNNICSLYQNNIKGRYDKKIAKLQRELDDILDDIERRTKNDYSIQL